MGIEQEKATAFVNRLWENPSLSGLSPLQKEEQLYQFLEANSAVLEPTLSSPAFFPKLPWPRILVLLKIALMEISDKALPSLISETIKSSMKFNFVQDMLRKKASVESAKFQLEDFLKQMSEKPNSRKELTGPLMGVGSGLIDRYVEKIFSRQRYIGFELRKVQRLKISIDEIADMIKAAMLIRPSVRYYSPESTLASQQPLLIISPAFASKGLKELTKSVTSMPESVLRSAVNSMLSFQDNPHTEGTARLAALFSHRSKYLKPGLTADRGAESSDKSWFSIARKNYKIYGFDLDMLVELQSIAAENGW